MACTYLPQLPGQKGPSVAQRCPDDGVWRPAHVLVHVGKIINNEEGGEMLVFLSLSFLILSCAREKK